MVTIQFDRWSHFSRQSPPDKCFKYSKKENSTKNKKKHQSARHTYTQRINKSLGPARAVGLCVCLCVYTSLSVCLSTYQRRETNKVDREVRDGSNRRRKFTRRHNDVHSQQLFFLLLFAFPFQMSRTVGYFVLF